MASKIHIFLSWDNDLYTWHFYGIQRILGFLKSFN